MLKPVMMYLYTERYEVLTIGESVNCLRLLYVMNRTSGWRWVRGLSPSEIDQSSCLICIIDIWSILLGALSQSIIVLGSFVRKKWRFSSQTSLYNMYIFTWFCGLVCILPLLFHNRFISVHNFELCISLDKLVWSLGLAISSVIIR